MHPIEQCDRSQVAGSSTDWEMSGGMLGARSFERSAGGDAQHQVQTGVALSREKAMLKHEVSQLREHFSNVQNQAESYVKAVKVSTMDKAKALLANRMAGYQQAAREHEAAAKDICEAEIAQTQALIV